LVVERDQTQAPFRDWLADISDIHVPAQQVELLVVPLQPLDVDHKIGMQLAKRSDRGRRDHAGAEPNDKPARTAAWPPPPPPGPGPPPPAARPPPPPPPPPPR